MYLGSSNDRKILNSAVPEKKTIFVENRKGHKRKLVYHIVLGSVFFFGPLKACADMPSTQASEVHLQDFCEFDSKESKPILFVNGGDMDYSNKQQIEMNDDFEMQRLTKSIEQKCLGTDLSVNKCIKKVVDVIEPIITDEKLWNIYMEFYKARQKGLDVRIVVDPSAPNPILNIGPRQEPKLLVPKMKPKGPKGPKGSALFAEGFQSINIGRKAKIPMTQNRVFPSKMSDDFFNTPESSDTFSEGLLPSGLSKNHDRLSETIRKAEANTQARRAKPLYTSQALANEVPNKSFLYSKNQLEKKSKHLKDLNITTTNNKVTDGILYQYGMETFLQKKNSILIRRPNATMNEQEPAYIFADVDSRLIIAFEKNPLYANYHFISAYRIDPGPFDQFLEFNNVGLSKEKRKYANQEFSESQRRKNQLKVEQALEQEFRKTVPQRDMMSNSALRTYQTVKEELAKDPNSTFQAANQKLLNRGDKWFAYREEFMKKKLMDSHPKISTKSDQKNLNDKSQDEL